MCGYTIVMFSLRILEEPAAEKEVKREQKGMKIWEIITCIVTCKLICWQKFIYKWSKNWDVGMVTKAWRQD